LVRRLCLCSCGSDIPVQHLCLARVGRTFLSDAFALARCSLHCSAEAPSEAEGAVERSDNSCPPPLPLLVWVGHSCPTPLPLPGAACTVLPKPRAKPRGQSNGRRIPVQHLCPCSCGSDIPVRRLCPCRVQPALFCRSPERSRGSDRTAPPSNPCHPERR